jgi:hypothetical protein
MEQGDVATSDTGSYVNSPLCAGYPPGFPLATETAKQSGQVTRLLRRLHIHQLVAKIPRSRRWRVSLQGRRVMAAAIKLREVSYPSLYAEAA